VAGRGRDRRAINVGCCRGLAHHPRSVRGSAAIDEDILKELYEHLVDPAEREWVWGEFYTPGLARRRSCWERAGIHANHAYARPQLRVPEPFCSRRITPSAAGRSIGRPKLVQRAVAQMYWASTSIPPRRDNLSPRETTCLALRAGDLRALRAKSSQFPVFMADTIAAPHRLAFGGRMVEIASADRWPTPQNKDDPSTAGSASQLPTERGRIPEACRSLRSVIGCRAIPRLSHDAREPHPDGPHCARPLAEWGRPLPPTYGKRNLRLLRATASESP